MRKRTLLVLVCLAMVCMVAVNGTLAQEIGKTFQNVVGFVTGLFGAPEADAERLQVQLTYQKRSGNQLVPLNETPVLYPAGTVPGFSWDDRVDVQLDGRTYKLWDDTRLFGAMDKFTSVTNTRAEAAYLRVAFAVKKNDAVSRLVHINFNDDTSAFDVSDWTDITIDGQPYAMIVYTYRGALAQGESTPPMLLQVAIDSSATNADFAAIGNDFLQINAMAVQASAFTKKVGEEEVPMTYAEALDAALPLDSFTPFQ